MTEAADMLALAARAGARASGHVEPNPLVGAVIAREGRVLGIGHHRRFGSLHAEREALAAARAAGRDVRGATLYVTLEPCGIEGKQPACTTALIEAGIGRVVAARRDPHPAKGGGSEVLIAAGIPVEFSKECAAAARLSDPFVKRVTTGRPWVIAKWAQTPEGETRRGPDGSRWISGERARRRVHRLRARVDAVVTGIGTVLADDPRLTARDVARPRRIARRVVIDPRLDLPPGSALVRTCREAPVTAACAAEAAGSRVQRLRDAGVEVIEVPGRGGLLDLDALLLLLVDRHPPMTNVLLECGETTLRSFFAGGLVDEAVIHIGGATDWCRAPRTGPAELVFAGEFEHTRARRLGADAEHGFRRVSERV